MDMKISGSGVIGAGEYENVRISGSGKLEGFVRCKNFSVSGAAHSDERLECSEEFHVSGSCSIEGGIKAGNLSVSGAFSCGKDISLSGDAKCSGSINCSGSFKGGYIYIAGKADIDGDMEGEEVKVSGKLNCGGLLNAEEVSIGAAFGMRIGSIGGSRIKIYRDGVRRTLRLPLLSSLISSSSIVRVNGPIEGDEIALEDVHAPRVSGRIVAIGEGCEIDLVQYTEKVEISPKAKVGRTEKMEKSPADEYTPPLIVPPVPVESVMPMPEELYDSEGNMRARVYAGKAKYVEIDGFGYYPTCEMYFDTEDHVRGINFPEGYEGNAYTAGHDKKSIYWKISKEYLDAKGPFFALIKFYDPETEQPERVLDGKYDRIMELPVREGILFFEEHIADAVIAGKNEAERIMKDGLLSVRHYAAAYVQDDSDPFLKAIEEQMKSEHEQ